MFAWTLAILAAWLLADFITGLFHWWEDVYLDEGQSLEFLQGIAQDNRQHHEAPTALTLNTWWGNMRSATLAAVPVACLLWWAGGPVWLWSGVACTSFGNLVHRWAHETDRKRWRVITWVQHTGLFISPRHHRQHHYSNTGKRVDPKRLSTRCYCPMTNWLNPLLDITRFWVGLEWLLARIGIHRIGTGGRSAS